MYALTDLLFLTGLACFFNHELDAIQQKEWRFFFQFIPLSDAAARQIFIALHAPLFVFILANLEQSWLQTGLDIFLLIHLGLHAALRNHPLVQFNNAYSWLWIIGGAACGAVHLIL